MRIFEETTSATRMMIKHPLRTRHDGDGLITAYAATYASSAML